jgi:ribosomal protein L21E
LGKSPFQVIYGREPRFFGITATDQIAPSDVQQWLAERALVMDSVRQHLLRMQQRMKAQADKRRSERQFAVGDKVFLKLQPYVQSSVHRRANHKLSFKFFGPHCVLARIGEVAYKIQLPEGSRIHPVFHVSQLKPCLRPTQKVQTVLPDIDVVHQIPVQVLQRRIRQKDLHTVPQVLVQWTGQSEASATWEDLEALRQRFPLAPAWGQAGFQGQGVVSDQAPPADGLQVSTSKLRPKRTRRLPAWLAGQEWAK